MRIALAIVLWAGLAPLRAEDKLPPLAPAEVDKSTQPALTIDNWQPKETPRPKPPEPAPEVSTPAHHKEAKRKEPPPAETPAPPASSTAQAVSSAPRVAMNEFAGVLS